MRLTCIECPMGCELEVSKETDKLIINGNGCPRGKIYAQNEIECPRRVLTTTVKTVSGKMVAVKTDAPVKKSEVFSLMQIINEIKINLPVKVGQIICENIVENINLLSTVNCEN